MIVIALKILSQQDEALCLKWKLLLKFDFRKLKFYLVDTNEAQTQGGHHLNYSRATVALDWEIGLQLW